ncbi:MAG: YfhO family protein [bacterium]|nr:YfhO family protein [bacterium]
MKSSKKGGGYLFRDYVVFGLYFLLAFILYAAFLFPSKTLMGTDWLNGGYANWVFMRDYIKEHKNIALWNPYIFSGMPTIGAFFPEILTLRFLSTFVLPIHVSHVLGFVFLLTVAAFSTYWFIKDYLRDDLIAVFAGILYGFSGLLVSTTYAGHLGRLTSMALFPLYLFLLKRGIDRGKLVYFLLMGSVVGYSFLNGHLQMTYFGILFLIAFFIFYNLSVGNSLKSGKFYLYAFYSILGGVVAALIYSFYLFPVIENLPYTARGAERGFEYAASWSMPPEEILNLITPRFSGILDEYWGRSYFKLHTEYMGILTLFFALVAILGRFKRDKLVRFLAIYGILVLFYVWGGYTPVFRVFYYVIPLVKKFRAPNLMFFVFNFISVFLASIALKILLSGDKESQRMRRVSIYSLIGLFLVFIVFLFFKNGIVTMFTGMLQRAKDAGEVRTKIVLLEDALTRLPAYFILSLVFAGAGLGAVFAASSKRSQVPYVILLAVISYVDLYMVDRNFIVDAGRSVEEMYGEDEVISQLKQDREIYRVFPLMYQRAMDGTLMIHRIHSIGGYTSSPPKRYQEFIGAGQSVMFNPQNLLLYPSMLNFLDCKYIIAYDFSKLDTTRYDENTKNAIRNWIGYLANFSLQRSAGQLALYRNNNNFGRVYFSEDYKVLSSDSILNLMKSWPSDSFKKYVLLEKEPEIMEEKIVYDGTLSLNMVAHNGNSFEISAKLPRSGFLVVSENYHPAWKFYIDGKRVETYLANYAFMAIYCPVGEHKILAKFESNYHRLGFILCFLGFSISLIALIIAIKRP